MVLENIVKLQKDVPAVMHFRAHRVQPRVITEKETGLPKKVNALVFDVDRLNGREVSATFSTLSEKLSAYFIPYFEGNRYTRYQFTIVQSGEDYQTEYEVTPTLYTG